MGSLSLSQDAEQLNIEQCGGFFVHIFLWFMKVFYIFFKVFNLFMVSYLSLCPAWFPTAVKVELEQ